MQNIMLTAIRYCRKSYWSFYRGCDKLEKATIQTIEEGVMTGDLYLISKLENKKKVDSKTFLDEIRTRLDKLM